jgi:hypothetical protein
VRSKRSRSSQGLSSRNRANRYWNFVSPCGKGSPRWKRPQKAEQLLPGDLIVGNEKQLPRVPVTPARGVDRRKVVRINLVLEFLDEELQAWHALHRTHELVDLAGDLQHQHLLGLEGFRFPRERQALRVEGRRQPLERAAQTSLLHLRPRTLDPRSVRMPGLPRSEHRSSQRKRG